MKRSAELATLSRDHHVALGHALRLRRAGADELPAAVARFLAFFVDEGERHFAREEEVLLPVVPGHADRLARRLLDEHAEIREAARRLGDGPDHAAANDVGELLAAHVRFEERELFPLLEAELPAAALAAVARRLDDA